MSDAQKGAPQFYKEIVPVDRTLHKNWTVRAIPDAGFTRNSHAVLVLASEFAELSREYPIVFVRNGDQVAPMAMLGLREGENLFVDEQGKWHARYVPAYVRRYPFTFSEVEGTGQLLLSLDPEYPGLSKDGGDGLRLFDEQGQDTDFLKGMLDFAQRFQDDYVRTLQFCKVLATLDLLKDMNVDAQLPTGARFNMGGFQIVDEEKLKALDNEEIARMFRNGMMGTIFAHLISLGNVTNLLPKLAEREAQKPEVTH